MLLNLDIDEQPTTINTVNSFFIDELPTFKSTAIYPNRIKDRLRVEDRFALYEKGNPDVHFYIAPDVLFAVGYDRIVYGDHGPYVEFSKSHIVEELAFKYANDDGYGAYYYEWMYPVSNKMVKVYFQLKSVKKLRNPPSGGFQGNRPEGYADYKPGKYYVDPFQFTMILEYKEQYA